MNQDMPTMARSTYASASYTGDSLAQSSTTMLGAIGQLSNRAVPLHQQAFVLADQTSLTPRPERMPHMANKQSRRLVQVFIADPDENVPLEKSLLYTGSQKLTDATDQELFFEIDMKSILEAHNTFRATVINKKVKERTEFLDAVKIRDLKMVVVDVATF